MLILSGDRIRKTEEAANSQGLSFAKMMEKAGGGCADFILSRFPCAETVCVLCGRGKNGGDGFVIARYLALAGLSVSVIKVFSCFSDDLSEANKRRLPENVRLLQYGEDDAEISEALRHTDIIVDAVFGTGFKNSLPEDIRRLFTLCNACKAVKIAVDVPSGLTCSQYPDATIIKADHTLSMLALKREQIYSPHRSYCGSTHIIPIGIDISCSKTLCALTQSEAASLLPKRPFNANKGSCGRALIIAGSRKMPGAAVLAAKGALNSGAGLTQLAFPDCCADGIMPKLTENIFLPLASDENGEFAVSCKNELTAAISLCSAAAAGCGMGTSENSAEILRHIVRTSRTPLIIDADGINILSKHMDILKEAVCPVLITPHPGEMARLTGVTANAVNASREAAAFKFAVSYNVYVLLKGENTVIASPDGRVYINPTGCSALARGGSGDLLTGIAVSLLAQGLAPFEALCLAAYIHGLAGDIAAERYSPYAATAERLISCIPGAFLKISESK